MAYDPEQVIECYTRNAKIEDQAEKAPSLRTEIPRRYIQRNIKSDDVVLDAGGGTGINAMMMAKMGASVTLLDLTPRILELARENIDRSGTRDRIEFCQGDICDLRMFEDGQFSLVVCVGDSLSYVLEDGERAMSELVRVAQRGAYLVLGADSKYGFMRQRLSEGDIDGAWEILDTSETNCGMGPRTRLYTVSEMESMLASNDCRVVEAASTPSLAATVDVSPYIEAHRWEELVQLELQICSSPELLGVGEHLMFVAQKD